MKGFLTFPLLLFLLFGTPAFADFQKDLNAYENGDYATVLDELKPLAELGETDAQYYLGGRYHNGEGVN